MNSPKVAYEQAGKHAKEIVVNGNCNFNGNLWLCPEASAVLAGNAIKTGKRWSKTYIYTHNDTKTLWMPVQQVAMSVV